MYSEEKKTEELTENFINDMPMTASTNFEIASDETTSKDAAREESVGTGSTNDKDSSTSEPVTNEAAQQPVILWLPPADNADKIATAKVRELVVLAILTEQEANRVVKTHNDICEAIKNLSANKRKVSQGAVSKSINNELKDKRFSIDKKIYMFNYDNKKGYQLLCITPEREAHEYLKNTLTTSKQLFLNNPTGVSSVYGFKIDLDKHEEAEEQFSIMLPTKSLFGFVSTEDTLFVLLDGSYKKFREYANKLRNFFNEDLIWKKN